MKNPHNFKLLWDSRTRVEKVPNSPLLCIGLAINSGQCYAALVDPITSTNYTLYANMSAAGSTSFAVTFKEIEREDEHDAVDAYFLAAGVYEYYYKGANWDFPVKPVESDNKGTKTDSNPDSPTYKKTNKYSSSGDIQIPGWFKDRFMT